MIKKFFVLIFISLFFLINTSSVVLADAKGAGERCTYATDTCPTDYSCQFDTVSNTDLCMKSTAVSTFGRIQLPAPLQNFLGTDRTGAAGISKFLSNAIALFYVVATIVLIFMILWGAFDWMISEGDKEKVANARNRIINAIIGIILFAVAFAIIQVLGQFTGFKFFASQNALQGAQGGTGTGQQQLQNPLQGSQAK